jgi:hypothetical protein
VDIPFDSFHYGHMPIIYDAWSVPEALDSELKLEGAVIAQIAQDQRGNAPNDVSVTVAELQRIADSSGPLADHVRRRQLVAVARN